MTRYWWTLVAGLTGLGLFGLSRVRGTIGKMGTTPTRGRVYVQGGALHGPVGDPIPLTNADKLWLARAIVGESGGTNRRAAAAVTWAMAQNLMLVGSSPPRMSTFTGIIRAYSQPVNPIWENRGTAAQQARRARIRTLGWSSIPQTTRSVVDDFWAGTLENPVPEMVDFAAFDFPGSLVNIEGNIFGIPPNRRIA